MTVDSHHDLEMLLRRIIRVEAGVTAVAPADKWRGGTLVLRPGTASREGISGLLVRTIARLRGAFPQARLLVRLDGGLGGPALLDRLEAVGVEYVIGLPGNAVLDRRAVKALRKARPQARATGQTAHGYTECRYAAQSWSRRRRVVIKAEVVAHPGRALRDNPRFVVTNRPERAQGVYEDLYCQRGDIENRIKELHHGLELDRTSCSRFWANQFRVLLTAAAYVVLQELRRHAARTGCARAQVTTLRERLLKLGARVSCRCGGLCCTCRPPRPSGTPGIRSPWPSGPARGRRSEGPHDGSLAPAGEVRLRGASTGRGPGHRELAEAPRAGEAPVGTPPGVRIRRGIPIRALSMGFMNNAG
jgi:hypothetical protein